MPGIIEGIAFMPPCRDGLTENDRIRSGVRRLNVDQPNSGGGSSGSCCIGSSSSVASPSSSSSPSGGGGARSGNQNTGGASAAIDGPDFDATKPYISYIVAVPDEQRFGTVSPQDLLKSWTGIVILFAHGNAEDLTGGPQYYWRLARLLGAAVVAYDYLGYGWSSGTKNDCTEANAFKAVRRMFNFVVGDCAKERSKLIVMGRSLGSGSATHIVYEECKRHTAQLKERDQRLKKKQKQQQQQQQNNNGNAAASSARDVVDEQEEIPAAPVAGLILYSPLYSAVAATGKLWASGIFGDIMCNYSKVGDIIKHVPIMIIHGTADEVIPFRCAKELFAKAGGTPKGIDGGESTETNPASSSASSTTQQPPRRAYLRVMPNCGHNDIEQLQGNAFLHHVTSFMRAECPSLGGGVGRRLGGGGSTQQSGGGGGNNAANSRLLANSGGNNNNSKAAPSSAANSGGYQFQNLGTASKPVVADDDPVWGKPSN